MQSKKKPKGAEARRRKWRRVRNRDLGTTFEDDSAFSYTPEWIWDMEESYRKRWFKTMYNTGWYTGIYPKRKRGGREV